MDKSKFEWKLENCWKLYNNGELIAKVDMIYSFSMGIDGWFYWIKGKRKPWLKRSESFSNPDMAKHYAVEEIERKYILGIDKTR